jgi:hypothetical protein
MLSSPIIRRNCLTKALLLNVGVSEQAMQPLEQVPVATFTDKVVHIIDNFVEERMVVNEPFVMVKRHIKSFGLQTDPGNCKA